MILRGSSDTNKIDIMRRTVQRISACVRIQWDGTGTFVINDLKSVTVKCELTRNGKKKVIFHDNLYVLALESMYFHAIEPLVLGSVSFTTMAVNQYLLPLMIDLGAPINLMGDDLLTFEASTTASWLQSNMVPAGCYIDFEFRDAIGVEHAVPTIKSKIIQASSAKISESLGENVTSIALISAAVSPLGNAETVGIFTSISITSDRYNINDNLDRMIARRASQFETSAVALYRGNNYVYRPETEIDNVQVSATMNAGNVSASVNYIVYRVFETDAYTMQRSIATTEKHEHRNHKKFLHLHNKGN